MSPKNQGPKLSSSVHDAMPFAKQAWAVSTEGERAAIRLGLIPLRLAVNFGKWSTPSAFRKALMEVAAKARGVAEPLDGEVPPAAT